MGSQIAGFTSANLLEVEANTRAARMTLRPEDYGSLGFYSDGGVSGTMAASLAANACMFSFRWTHASNLALIKRVTISAGDIAGMTTAQAAAFSLFGARTFTASDSGGTSLLPSGSQNKMRTSGMGTTLAADIRISSTAALTAGTRTLDTNALGTVCFGWPTTAGASLISPPVDLLDIRPGEHPLILAQNEGFVINNVLALGVGGTWGFAVRVFWGELTAY